jgi:hypothetical protein
MIEECLVWLETIPRFVNTILSHIHPNLSEVLNSSDMEYDVVSGISVGAINSGALAIHKKGEEKEATEYLR